MNTERNILPRLLVIDDMFGRTCIGPERNQSREGLCVKYRLQDVTGDEATKEPGLRVKNPIAEAVFCRAQTPNCSELGDTVENDLEGCLEIVEAGWHVKPKQVPWSLVLLDLCFYTGTVTEDSNKRNTGMPEGRPGDDSPESYFGLKVLEAIQKQYPEIPVIILSSMSRGAVSKQFSTCGALGFLDRTADESPDLLESYLWRHGLLPDNTGMIIGHSKAMLLAMRSARRMASSRRNILIRGPRGSGKGLIANYVHMNSENRQSGFIPVNLGGTNPHLYESLLFGHVKGAFSGADKDRKGFIEEAHNGTLFIDEIAGIPSQVQYGLLHVLEDRKVTRLGANVSTKVNVHFISATNEDIESIAAGGQGFRADLLDRLREGGTLRVPPLAERKEDIYLLAEHFVKEAEAQFTNAHHRNIDPEAFDKLMQHSWPGNIRELRKCIFEAVSDNLDVEHLVPHHINLPETERTGSAKEPEYDGRSSVPGSTQELNDILELLSGYDFSMLNREYLIGQLDDIEQACRRFTAHYLKATLERTLTPIESKVQITPAMKMATGNKNIKASKAADMIKRILKGLDCSSEDEVLFRALQRAIELRPRKRST